MKNGNIEALNFLIEKYANDEFKNRYRLAGLNNYHSFIMERENFLFVFERRLKNAKSRGKIIKGLQETLAKFQTSEFQKILSHSFELNNYPYLIYTDEEITKLFGIIDPND